MAADLVRRYADAIVGVELVVTVKVKMGDREMPPREQRIEVNGTVVTPEGLTVTSLAGVDPQVQFDTLTWGRRHVGRTRSDPPMLVELFALFDDPFVQHQFHRRRRIVLPSLGRAAWLPRPEDLVVQKLRCGRGKDLDDARDVLAVQGLDHVDLAEIRVWCLQHGTIDRLDAVLAALPAE